MVGAVGSGSVTAKRLIRIQKDSSIYLYLGTAHNPWNGRCGMLHARPAEGVRDLHMMMAGSPGLAVIQACISYSHSSKLLFVISGDWICVADFFSSCVGKHRLSAHILRAQHSLGNQSACVHSPACPRNLDLLMPAAFPPPSRRCSGPKPCKHQFALDMCA